MKRIDWFLALASTLLSLLAAEIFLNQFANLNSRPAFALGGFRIDSREWLHALYDLRADGIDAYPIVSADVYTQFFLDRNDPNAVVPLAGLSKTATTFCNELKNFIVYQSDRYGFRNDDRLWDAKPSVMLVGDSYSQGACVPDGATIPAQLAQLGFPAVSVAYNSNGPLTELGALIEYGPLVKPQTVVWIYYEGNDLPDLAREIGFPMLRKYFEPGFSQGLAGRQTEIDGLVKSALDVRPEIQSVKEAARNHWDWRSLVQLRNVRALLGDTFQSGVSEKKQPELELDDAVGAEVPRERLAELESILSRARDVTASWNGQLVFFYLPASERYRFPNLPAVAELSKTQASVMQIARNLNLPVFDLGRAFATVKDPTAMFPKADWPVHLTEDGYRLIAKQIAADLRATVAPVRN